MNTISRTPTPTPTSTSTPTQTPTKTASHGPTQSPAPTGRRATPIIATTLNRWYSIPTLGAIIWAMWAWAYTQVLGWSDWPSIALMFSPFVIVPLGLTLVQRPETGPVVPALSTLGRLAPLAAIAVAASFLVPAGWPAALLTVPWLIVTGSIAVVGILRTLSRRHIEPGMAVDAGLVFLAMGAIWVTTSRLGANPLGYDDLLVLLTAVHLHYAGFVVPLVAGLTSIRCRTGATVPAAAVAAIPITGLGVALSGSAEWIAATFMALCGLATAWLLASTAHSRAVHRRPSAAGTASTGLVGRGLVGRGLVVVSAVSLAAAMLLGLGWAWSVRFDWGYFDVLEMARFHGMLNAFGFALIGLVGLNLLPPLDAPQRRVVARLAVASAADLERMAVAASTDTPTTGATAATCTSVASVALPHGFDAGRAALLAWAGHDAAGIRRWPERPNVAEGTTLALSSPIGPVAIAATLRITEVVDEADRFGFTYAALSDHPETGYQTMMIERTSDGNARAVVTTSCGPWLLLSQLMPRVTERFQAGIRERYLAGIADWCEPSRLANPPLGADPEQLRLAP